MNNKYEALKTKSTPPSSRRLSFAQQTEEALADLQARITALQEREVAFDALMARPVWGSDLVIRRSGDRTELPPGCALGPA